MTETEFKEWRSHLIILMTDVDQTLIHFEFHHRMSVVKHYTKAFKSWAWSNHNAFWLEHSHMFVAHAHEATMFFEQSHIFVFYFRNVFCIKVWMWMIRLPIVLFMFQQKKLIQRIDRHIDINWPFSLSSMKYTRRWDQWVVCHHPKMFFHTVGWEQLIEKSLAFIGTSKS
jgi:hypothetical protein